MKLYNIAVVGTGAVGSTILQVLEERNFPVGDLKLLATKNSAGKKLVFQGKEYTIEETFKESFKGVDIALFAGGKASELYAEAAAEMGAIVIDNSSYFRMNDNVPLVVPEVNPEAVKNHKGIIANPNCSTIQMCVALKPINDYSKIKRVVVSTYQAVSGAGQEAMDELVNQTKEVLSGEEATVKVFQHQIAMNLIPHIDVFKENFYTKEEMKMTLETQKIFNDYEMRISATAVRVPILRSHSEAITVETAEKISRDKALELFGASEGIILQDDIANNVYPMPFFTSDTDEVYVGRVREDIAFDKALSFFVVADQLRKGAATNAIQIAELLVRENMVGDK
ncbi:MAG: aspartate-semialdehyde dehydrogenase [Fusobacteria bacterium]|nr:MAG: aspartate-semialdehyde dehydrogenase [Fusobacteriota bacterium]KAF0230060.1 MAG: aspartate-semialdehyde [Fusobacteriota bacterium]